MFSFDRDDMPMKSNTDRLSHDLGDRQSHSYCSKWHKLQKNNYSNRKCTFHAGKGTFPGPHIQMATNRNMLVKKKKVTGLPK